LEYLYNIDRSNKIYIYYKAQIYLESIFNKYKSCVDRLQIFNKDKVFIAINIEIENLTNNNKNNFQLNPFYSFEQIIPL
jgi:hypothetical protein